MSLNPAPDYLSILYPGRSAIVHFERQYTAISDPISVFAILHG
jgi:hypothetical protein